VPVRQPDSTLRRFFNVCRHHGHELLAPGASRHARGIRCPYHAWVYGLDGACRASPLLGEPGDGFDQAEFPLVDARVFQWRRWVFANVSGDAPPLADQLGNLDPVVGDCEPERLVAAAGIAYEIAANWRIVVENYLECYHCSGIHPELCRVTPPESDLCYSQPPSGLWLGGATACAITPRRCRSPVRPGVPIPTVPPARRREVAYVAVLPSLLVSGHPDYVMTHRLTPLAHDRTAIECEWLFPPEAMTRTGFSPNFATQLWDVTNRQDWLARESVHRNASSPGFRPGAVSLWEADVWRAMAVVARGHLDGRFPVRGPGAAAVASAVGPG
jgi:Rieske 2Fe-2S family protein